MTAVSCWASTENIARKVWGLGVLVWLRSLSRRALATVWAEKREVRDDLGVGSSSGKGSVAGGDVRSSMWERTPGGSSYGAGWGEEKGVRGAAEAGALSPTVAWATRHAFLWHICLVKIRCTCWKRCSSLPLFCPFFKKINFLVLL